MTPEILAFVRKLLSAILDIVPVAVARQMLDDAAVRRANAIADAAEIAKFAELDKLGDD